MMDLHPAIVDLLGCGEAFYTNGTGRISNHDLEAGAIRLRSDLALNGLGPPLEEVEHDRSIIARVDRENGSA